jgi:hypothetical protein
VRAGSYLGYCLDYPVDGLEISMQGAENSDAIRLTNEPANHLQEAQAAST